ncbi:MAG TPA: hypothetical protein P5084_13580 [Paludibacter sp.]|nr:hypothetical protein [Paludibacter sp.]
MKFIVSSTVLLSHLQAISGKNKSKNFTQEFEDFHFQMIEQFELDFSDYENQFIIAEPVVADIHALQKGSIKEILRRLSLYLSNNTTTQLLHSQNSIYRKITIFFGLCCSRPSYIFSAVLGVSASRILSSVPALN